MNLERVLHTLAATQEVPRHIHFQSRGTPRGSPQIRRSAYSHFSAGDDGSFHCVVGKGIPAFPSHLKRRRSNRKSRGNPGVVPPFQNTPICLSPFQKKLISLHASTVTWIIYSHHGGTCDSPLGKPRGKATDPCVNWTGSLTLLVQLGRKADMNVSTRAKD